MDLALTLTLVGMTVVFAALIILAFLISALSKAVNSNKNINADKQNNVLITPVTSTSSIDAKTGTDVQNDDELVAVITAAILASMKQEPDFRIRVKSLRRIQDNSPAWNVAGKLSLLNANMQ